MFISFSEWAAKNVFATGKALNNEKKNVNNENVLWEHFLLAKFFDYSKCTKIAFPEC